MNVWLENALEFVRDQLRTNSVVGLDRDEGAKMIEVGTLTLGQLSSHVENEPAIWITPLRSSPERGGNVIDHRVELELQIFASTPKEPINEFMEGQKAHRQLVGKVWNEALNLRDAGITNLHWQDWWPGGDVEWLTIPLESRALLGGSMRFRFLAEKVWETSQP